MVFVLVFIGMKIGYVGFFFRLFLSLVCCLGIVYIFKNLFRSRYYYFKGIYIVC